MPMTPEEIAEAAYECWKEGAAVVHIHMRDEEGHPTMRVDLFEKTIKRIREKCDVIINMTSSGGHSLDGMASDETRMLPFRTLKPEMGSFDCGTLNWLHQTIFENSPKFLEQLGHLMQEVGCKPEPEIFDVGMVDTAKYYLKTGVLKAPCHFQLVCRAAAIIREAGYEVATPAEAREILGIRK